MSEWVNKKQKEKMQIFKWMLLESLKLTGKNMIKLHRFPLDLEN